MGKLSKGERASVSRADVKMIRRERTYTERMDNINKAWKAGKNPWITIVNPDSLATNEKLISVKTNTLWGDPKKRNKVAVNTESSF